MKIRSGFVTNSSSSSFVVSLGEGIDPEEMFKAIFKADLLKTEEDVKNYFLNEYGCSEGDISPGGYDYEEYEKFLSKIKGGKSIFVGFIDYDSGEIMEGIESLATKFPGTEVEVGD